MLCILVNSCAVYTVDECYPSTSRVYYYDYYGNIYYKPAPPRYRPAPRPVPNRYHHPVPNYSKPSPKPSVSKPHHKPNPRPAPSSRQHNKPNNRR